MPSPPPSSGDRRYFIAAGSANYPHLGDTMTLKSVARDLEQVSDYFRSQGCARALPDIAFDPKLTSIRDQLPVWAQQVVTDGDMVVFYYSGHGSYEDRYYLLVSDSQDGLLDTTAIPVEELGRWLVKNSAARQIVIIIDACYAGRGANELLQIGGRLAELLASSPGVFAIAAASTQDEAQEGEFSKAFCEALANRDGRLGWRTQPYIFAEALIDAINERLERAKYYQRAQLVSSTKESCRLFPNPLYQPSIPANIDIQAQRDFAEHWLPKARGAEFAGESTWYFTGRRRALREITSWLCDPRADHQPRIVTGRPGVGKSALLGRLVALSDPTTREEALRSTSASDDTVPPEGAVQVAVHARRRSLRDMVELLAAHTNTQADDPTALVAQFAERDRTVIVVDAVDEAAEPRRIVEKLLRPLGQLPNVQLVVGMRPDATSGHVTAFGESIVEIDLGAPDYADPADVLSYAQQRLAMAAGPAVGAPVPQDQLAQQIARRAGDIFLIARILCDTALLESGYPSLSEAEQDQDSTVFAAFAEYLDRLDLVEGLGRTRAIDLMTPLAFAEGDGIPWEGVWPDLASALSGRVYKAADIEALLTHAGAYIVEANVDDRSVYRLYHEALAEYLRSRIDAATAHRAITEALIARVPERANAAGPDWRRAHPYTLERLAGHAAPAGLLPKLLDEADFLLHATPQTLAAALQSLAFGSAGKRADAYLGVYSRFRGKDLSARLQYLALGAAMADCLDLLEELRAKKEADAWFVKCAWYRDAGGHAIASVAAQNCACLIHTAESMARLVIVGDHEVTVLDLSTGDVLDRFAFEGRDAKSAIEVPTPEDQMLAISYYNGHICLLDLNTRSFTRRNASKDQTEIAVVERTSDTLLAVGKRNGEVQFWSVPQLELINSYIAHNTSISVLKSTRIEGSPVLITGSDSHKAGDVCETNQIKIWNPDTLELIETISGPRGNMVRWLDVIQFDGKYFIISYYFPHSVYVLHSVGSNKRPEITTSAYSNPFALVRDGDGFAVLSGFSDVFSWARVGIGSDQSPMLVSSPGLRVDTGRWLGPIGSGAAQSVISIAGDVRVWNLQDLKDRASAADIERVGLIEATGEPLFCLSAPADSPYFAGISQYGNLRIWSNEGTLLSTTQLVTTLEGSQADDAAEVQLVDFAGQCLCVLFGSNGSIRAMTQEGEPVGPHLKVDAKLATAFGIHAESDRLVAAIALRNFEKYEVSVWDLPRGAKITDGYRFSIPGYEDKTIRHVAVLEHAGRTIVASALDHSVYHYVCAWHLDRPAVSRRTRSFGSRRAEAAGRYPPLWMTWLDAEITCLATVRHRDAAVLAVGHINGGVTVLDPADGDPIDSYKAHTQSTVAICAAWIGDGNVLISASADGTIVAAASSVPSDGQRVLFTIETGVRVTTMAVVPGSRLVVGTNQGFLLFDL